MAMVLTQASLCPLLSAVFALLAFFIGYAIAVAKDHVDAFLPYISDCGNLQPESGIFGQLLNLSAFFLMITVYFVHRNFVVIYEKIEGKYLGKWRIVSICLMFLGFLSAIGASMVANFQEGVQLATHDTGAFTFFIGITIYFWGQVVVGLILRPKNVNLCLTIFRLALCIAISVFLVFHLTCLFANPFIQKKDGVKPEKPTFPNGIERYKKGDPFYWNHIATTMSEWLLALLIEAYVVTFTFELAYTKLEAPTVKTHGSLKSLTIENPERPFYTDQVAPMDQILPLQPLEVKEQPPMRRLPRIDYPYGYGTGTYSRVGNGDVTYSAYKPGNEDVVVGTYSHRSLKENTPYERSKTIASYNQYQYF